MPREYFATRSSARAASPTRASTAATAPGPMPWMRPSTSRLRRPERYGKSAGLSTIEPMRGITVWSLGPDGTPSTVARPPLLRTSPSSIRIVVVLPEPFGPRNPNTPPSGTLRSSPPTATFLP